MKHQQKGDFNPQKKVFRLIKIFLGILVVVFVLEIWVANRLATNGKQIQDIKQAQANLILENQILENSIAQNMSLSIIEQRAGKLGFSSK
ncbi:MAG: hypothetical protein Q7R43_04955 [Candidatus Daviesbacteria bacterium]|nr:hypothetical protein [Candidatus Daviesbacteria bacterium]